MYLRDMYEDRHKVYPHLSKTEDRPMAAVAFHDTERYDDVSYLRSSVRRYFDQKVYERTGMTPEQFLHLPVNFSRILLEELTTVNKREEASATEAEEKISRSLQGIKNQ